MLAQRRGIDVDHSVMTSIRPSWILNQGIGRSDLRTQSVHFRVPGRKCTGPSGSAIAFPALQPSVVPPSGKGNLAMSKRVLRSTRGLVPGLFGLLLVVSCSQVALTGRKQLNLVPDSEMLSTSTQQYDQFMKENKASSDAEQTERVKRVGARIQAAVEEYARQQNRTKDLEGYAWEFNLVESKAVT